MIEPITLSVPELAERWSVTPRQILEHALALRLPVLFPFDGLAFDQADRWLMGHGAADEQRELDHKREWVASCEAQIKRNAAGLTDEFDRLGRDDVISLRRQITEAEKRIEVLTDLLEARERERRKREYRGHMRALPDTLWTIQQNGEVTFPRLAMHPLSAVQLTEFEGRIHWDGRIMALEPGIAGQWKPRLCINDLLVPMQAIREWEAANNDALESQAKHTPKWQLQDRAMLDTLRKLGYTPEALPPKTPGSDWVKAQARRELALRKDLFTTKTFDSTWERLRKSGDIAEQT
jgi:hypothetical protein